MIVVIMYYGLVHEIKLSYLILSYLIIGEHENHLKSKY